MSNLRSYHAIAPVGVLAAGEVTVAEVARRLDVSASAVYGWIKGGKLAARRACHGRLCVPFGADVERTCREQVAASTQLPRSVTTTPAAQQERSVASVATPSATRTTTAMAESFSSTVQRELLDEHRWTTRHQLALAVFEWIEAW